MPKRPAPDLTAADHGSIWLLTPLTPAGEDWIDEHIPKDAQTFGGSIVVEHRYIADIIAGARNDGLEVSA